MTDKARELGNEPSFPFCPTDEEVLLGGTGNNKIVVRKAFYCGTTKRELGAFIVMKGLCANPELTKLGETELALRAAKRIDALLEELARESGK